MPAHAIPEVLAPDLLDRVRARFHPWPLIRDWGLVITDISPGRAEMRLEAKGLVVNGSRGNVNGGVLATMADMTSALALCTAFDGAMPFATSDLHLRYLEPAFGEVVARAEVVRISGRGAVTECRIHSRGHVAALCTAHFAITRRTPG
ncbi:MAG: PaaI family thioesterase [Acidobacteria bacterium]|nr:PaaI family thioesterase [Acidobacteriota bacterium]